MKYLNLIIGFLFLCVAPAICKPAVITGKIDIPAQEVLLKPFADYMVSAYFSAKVKVDGTFKLEADIDTPLLCEMSFYCEGIPNGRCQILLMPNSNLHYTKKGKESIFEGKYSNENKVAKDVYSHMLYAQLANPSIPMLKSKIKEVEDLLAKSNITPEATNFFKDLIHTQAEFIKLSEAKKENKSEYSEILANLLKRINKTETLTSLYNWQTLLNHLLIQAEEEKLLEKGDNIFTNRVSFIKSERVKELYAVYCFEIYIQGRRWFNEDPEKIISFLEPFMKNSYPKAEFEGIKDKYNKIKKSWEHLHKAPAPDFTFEDISGKMVSLKDFRGKFVMLDIWNIYCGPCIKQVPYIKKMSEDFKRLNVEFIGVSADPQDIKDKWQKVVKDKGMEGYQLITDKGRESRFFTDFPISGFPTFYLIGPDGWVIEPEFSSPEQPEFLPKLNEAVKNWKPRKYSKQSLINHKTN